MKLFFTKMALGKGALLLVKYSKQQYIRQKSLSSLIMAMSANNSVKDINPD